MTFIIILIIVAVLAFFVVGAYNTLVKSRMQTQEAWSQIDVQLKRRRNVTGVQTCALPIWQPWKR